MGVKGVERGNRTQGSAGPWIPGGGSRTRPVGFAGVAGLVWLALLGASLVPTGGAIAAAADAPGAPAPPPRYQLPAEIRVGITPNYPPLAFERDGRIVGVEPDLADAVAKVLGVKLTLVEIPWDELAQALAAKEIDVVMSGVSVTERRKQLASFTRPYLEIGQMVLIRKQDLGKRSAPEAIREKGARVGVERLTTGARYARENLAQATVVEFDSIDAGLEALREGRIDFFIHDAPTVWRLTGRFTDADEELVGLYRPLTREEIAWAVRKDEAATLGAALDGALAKLQADGRVQAILDRWITVRKVTKEIAPAS